MDYSKLFAILALIAGSQTALAGGEPRDDVAPVKQEQATTAAASGDPARGKEIFESDFGCSVCHGMDALGSVGPNIRQVSIEQVYHAVQNFPDMMNWKYNFPQVFEDQALLDIVAYLNTLEREPSQ